MKPVTWKRKRIENCFKIMYNNELTKKLNVTSIRNFTHDIDCLIIGSDEVFNCLQTNPLVGFAKELFGKGYEDKLLLSYAACFGTTNLTKLKEYGIDKEISEMLLKFHAISVRDENSYDIVRALTGKTPLCHLDPVLVGDFIDTIPNTVRDEDYIIIYAYPGRITKEEAKKIRSFANKRNKKIYSIGNFQECADRNIIATPFELLDYIRKSDFVITDTFHGSIFSIKCNKQFATMIRTSNQEKLRDLLRRLKQEERSIKSFDELDNMYVQDINFQETNEIIKRERQRTLTYLEENLN